MVDDYKTGGDGSKSANAAGKLIGKGAVDGLIIGVGGALSKGSKVGVAGDAAVNTGSKVSPKVQNILKSIDEIKLEGGEIKIHPLKPIQEVNMTIQKGGEKINLRIETHRIDNKNGGNGATPQRHMNVDYYNNGKRKTNDHTILEP